MSNPLNVGCSNTNQAPSQQPNLQQLYQQFIQNPIKYLTNLGIPDGMSDPSQIVQFLAQNNRIPPMLMGRVNSMLAKKM